MRKHLVSIVVALVVAGLVGHVVWQAAIVDPRRTATTRAALARRHARQMTRRAEVMERNEPYRTEREALGLSPPEYRKRLAQEGRQGPDAAELRATAKGNR